MIMAEGVVVARNLGEARAVIGKLALTNWVPVAPSRPKIRVMTKPLVLVVDSYDVPDVIWRNIKVAAGVENLQVAAVSLV